MGSNPFRYIGSYVGLVVGLVAGYFSFAFLFAMAEIGKFREIYFFIPIVLIVLGFLIGWRIHLLIKVKK